MLKCLGVLGAGNKAATEAMTDVLAKVAAGHAAAAPRGAGRRGGGTTGAAVATEAAVTIMRIEPVPTLRSYAVQIMANLLKQPDNNLRCAPSRLGAACHTAEHHRTLCGGETAFAAAAAKVAAARQGIKALFISDGGVGVSSPPRAGMPRAARCSAARRETLLAAEPPNAAAAWRVITAAFIFGSRVQVALTTKECDQ